MPTEQKVRITGPSIAHSITMALGDMDASLRRLCRNAVLNALDVIEGKTPWYAMSSLTLGATTDEARDLADRVSALRKRLTGGCVACGATHVGDR